MIYNLNKKEPFRTVLLIPMVLLILILPHESSSKDPKKDNNTIVLSAIMNEQTHAVAKKIIAEAYRRIGYRVEFDDLPAQRALEWAENGITDGDVARIDGTAGKYPHLIQVETPVISFQGIAFTKTVDKAINNWDDLKEFRIGIIRGIRYAEIGTQGMEPFLASDMTHLFTILELGRIELAVAVLDAGRIEIEKKFKGSDIHPVGKPLFEADLYHFVHEKHQELVMPLNRVLQEMTKNGEIEMLKTKTVESFFHQ